MSYTLDHSSSRQIVPDYTQLFSRIKRLMHILRNANGSL
ncbi:MULTISPECIES: hypothetical protein [Kosakonia]|uniref:Uncharacterized protein n=1 Tax=Kosakonia quasisacchari TaxID=2529380 RepID=A0A4R0I187_9ENTR|nr:hypothetical protein [Kosakonia quasisacchari]TCC13959.1 hypothetical protein E0L21_05195 [Kosakonia quasisacchari]